MKKILLAFFAFLIWTSNAFAEGIPHKDKIHIYPYGSFSGLMIGLRKEFRCWQTRVDTRADGLYRYFECHSEDNWEEEVYAVVTPNKKPKPKENSKDKENIIYSPNVSKIMRYDLARAYW